MRQTIFLLAILLLSILPVEAASRWVAAGHFNGPDGKVSLWADMNSMHQAGPHQIEVWLKYLNAHPDHSGISRSLIYEHLHCDTNEYATISLMSYAEDGRVLDAESGPANATVPIVPDSVLAGMMPFICAAGLMPQR
jgi:hypothetical protein